MWYGWLALALVIGATAWLCRVLYGDRGGGMHCIGCGACAATGACVLKRQPYKKADKKSAASLDKTYEKDIINPFKQQNAGKKSALQSGSKREGRR